MQCKIVLTRKKQSNPFARCKDSRIADNLEVEFDKIKLVTVVDKTPTELPELGHTTTEQTADIVIIIIGVTAPLSLAAAGASAACVILAVKRYRKVSMFVTRKIKKVALPILNIKLGIITNINLCYY